METSRTPANEPPSRTDGGSTRLWRRVDRAILLCFAVGMALHLASDKMALVWDQYGYAQHSRAVLEALTGALRPSPLHPAAQAWSRFYETAFHQARPPFFLPAVAISGLIGLPWDVRTILFLDDLVYLPMLFCCTRRLASLTARASPLIARLVATSLLVTSPVVWQMGLDFMATLSVAAVVAWLLLSSFLAGQRGFFRDFASSGAALALGLVTKPIFTFFALPIVLFLVFRIGRDAWTKRRDLPATLLRIVVTFAPPGIVLIATFDEMLAQVRELYLMNEQVRYFLQQQGSWTDWLWPVTFASQAWPVHLLPLAAATWVLGAFRSPGRCLLAFILPLLGYVTAVVNQRHATHFPGLLPALAVLSAIGVDVLPGLARRIFAGAWAVAAITMAVSVTFPGLDLRERLLREAIIIPVASADGGLTFQQHPIEPWAVRSIDPYERVRVPEVIRATGLDANRGVRVYVASGRRDFNLTTLSSWLLMNADANWGATGLSDNLFRYGGFGAGGGLRPEFFSSDFVLTITEKASEQGQDSDFYHVLVSRELALPGSKFRPGLEPVQRFDLGASGILTLFHRTRSATAEEAADMLDQLIEKDPGNAWNCRYAALAMQTRVSQGQGDRARAIASWVVSFRERGPGTPELRHDIVYRGVLPELGPLFRSACLAAEQTLATVASRPSSR